MQENASRLAHEAQYLQSRVEEGVHNMMKDELEEIGYGEEVEGEEKGKVKNKKT